MGFRNGWSGNRGLGNSYSGGLAKNRKAPHRRFQHESLESRLVLSSSSLLPAMDQPGELWTMLEQVPPSAINAESILRPQNFVPFTIDHDVLRDALAIAPLEFTEEAEQAQFTLDIPSPDGSLETFEIFETMVMHPDLAAKFPDIKTYRGQGIDNPSSTIRLDLTPLGFHAQVLSPEGSYYVDPYYHLDTSVYVSYAREGLQLDPETMRLRQEMQAETLEDPEEILDEGTGVGLTQDGGVANRSGTQLRTYRLANAATGEYTARFGGTVPLGQAAIVTAINRVTGVYEAELAIRLQLVPNNDLLVYTNSATDPYTNNDGVAMLSQNQTNVTTVIGSANYDIGHVFSTGGGGVASLGVVGVNSSKARGVTGLPNPIGDAFYIDYVAHEMGHQFGGNHTFNGDSGSCAGGNRSSIAAYEPGSGSTIMAYAGICGNDDLQSNSDAYFHSVSFDEIIRLVDVTRPTVGTRTATGNLVPTANAGPDYTIPANTPFKLTGSGTDGNGDALTYNWEQRDLGPQQDVSAPDNGTSPLWRSWNATTSPTRYFPRLLNLVNNTTVRGEKYALTTRNMNFRLTVRDNRSGGGGVNTDDTLVRTVNTGAAFAVTSPNTSVSWPANSIQTVTWNVAGTTGSGINTSQVNILLSTDGGFTYPTMLASATDNDGSQTVTLPNISSTTARIMVESVGNVFFDISNLNFSITADTTPPTANASAFDITASAGTTHDINVTYIDGNVIDVSDIDNSDIQVLTPSLSLLPASLVSVSSGTDTSPVFAVYRINAPGGGWDPTDNGTYTIQMVANQVTDGSENPVPAGNLATFNVNITSDNVAPTATASAPNINSAGGSTQQVTVTYTDNAAVSFASISNGDIQVIAPDTTVISGSLVSVNPGSDGSPMTAVYQILAPGGAWDVADNGSYSIQAIAGEVLDTSGNSLAAGVIGSFTVNISPIAPGDFDADGDLDCADVNALSAAIANATGNLLYDVTGDSVVNSADLDEWVLNLKETLFGDVNLDFFVDGSDFNIWNANKFTSNTNWCAGNLNADLVVDGADFGIWNSNKFTAAFRALPNAAPPAIRETAARPLAITASEPRLKSAVAAINKPAARQVNSPKSSTQAVAVPAVNEPTASVVSRQKLKTRELRDRVFADLS